MCGSQFAQQLQIKNVPVKPQCGLKQSAADLMFSNVTEMTDILRGDGFKCHLMTLVSLVQNVKYPREIRNDYFT